MLSSNLHTTLQFATSNPDYLLALTGSQARHLSLYEEAFDVELSLRGEVITVKGDNQHQVEQTVEVLETLTLLMDRQIIPRTRDIVIALQMAKAGQLNYFLTLYDEVIGKTKDGTVIRPKSFGQLNYVREMKQRDVIFGIGPAGTGKTFLAVMMAVEALKTGRVKRIILTRPAVEAGENLGFLPGDLKEKVDPYLRPIYDALYTIYGLEQTERLLERGTVEIAPLAYMRGRTLDDAFVILDEAQNTTIAQMKMFLTRLGFGSQMVVNGDWTQIDLPRGVTSGLIDAERKLKSVSEVGFVYFDELDVVRHPVVANIIRAYEN